MFIKILELFTFFFISFIASTAVNGMEIEENTQHQCRHQTPPKKARTVKPDITNDDLDLVSALHITCETWFASLQKNSQPNFDTSEIAAGFEKVKHLFAPKDVSYQNPDFTGTTNKYVAKHVTQIKKISKEDFQKKGPQDFQYENDTFFTMTSSDGHQFYIPEYVLTANFLFYRGQSSEQFNYELMLLGHNARSSGGLFNHHHIWQSPTGGCMFIPRNTHNQEKLHLPGLKTQIDRNLFKFERLEMNRHIVVHAINQLCLKFLDNQGYQVGHPEESTLTQQNLYGGGGDDTNTIAFSQTTTVFADKTNTFHATDKSVVQKLAKRLLFQ